MQLQQVISPGRSSFRFDNKKDCQRVDVPTVLGGLFRYHSPFGQNMPEREE